MTPSPSPSSESTALGVLQLRPPIISGLVEPIAGEENYDGGIGIVAFENNLLITVHPWQMRLGDECRLFFQNVLDPIRLEVIDTEDKLNKDVVFKLTALEVLDGSARVFYRVNARNQTPETSDELNVFVKRTRPGGELTQPHPEGHPDLRYRFVPDVAGGVDQGMADNGIRLSVSLYRNISLYDRIIARWGEKEESVFYPVTRQNIDDPTRYPIEAIFTKQQIERAGDGIHSVTFQVIDRCQNRPHDFAPWAIPTKVEVKLGGSTNLPPPDIEGEQGGVVDPTYVTNIKVTVPKAGLRVNDRVRVQWQGRVPRETLEQTYLSGERLTFDIPVDWARESDEGPVTLTYKVRNAAPERTSEHKTTRIKMTIDPQAPKVLEAYGAQGERLKMADIYYATHITIQVPPYPGMAIGQTLRARWASERHVYDSPITTVQRVGPMNFNVPRLEVIDAIGTKVPVEYTVRNFPNGPLHRSRVLPLAVDPQALDLTPPRLTTDRTRVTVRFPGMAAGYHARVRITGVATRETDWQELKADVTAEFRIPRTWIDENEGKDVLFNYSIHRSGSTDNLMFSQLLRVTL
ncbi:hypothetical protein [Pseudomonas lini]